MALPAVAAGPPPPAPADQAATALAGLDRAGPAGSGPGPGPEPESGPRLLYRPWHPEDPLAPDHCGIPAPLASGQPTRSEPAAGEAGEQEPPQEDGALPGVPPAAGLPPAALGLLLVPALAIDRQGVRLGYGGGWYDRLRAEPAWRAVPALAVLPAACVVEALPRDGWDVPFAGWLDETGLHRIRDTGLPAGS
ncbi:MAG: 5-formyltetrahydrofolate cyclo-ligase [Cyanobium sp.]